MKFMCKRFKLQIIHAQIVQYYIIISLFSLKQLVMSVKHILHPRLAVIINPSQHYTRVEVSLIQTHFPCQPNIGARVVIHHLFLLYIHYMRYSNGGFLSFKY